MLQTQLLPWLIALSLLEGWRLQSVAARRFAWRGVGTSIAIAAVQPLAAMATLGAWWWAFDLVWQHRLFSIALDNVWAPCLLLLLVDFLYYWQHRASHRIAWFWASHCVHHSSTEFNLSAAYRLGWTAGVTGTLLFYLPLVWIGFAPQVVLAALGLNLLYQAWLHTELIGELGAFERWFNSPAHHRRHHAANPSCHDRNFGGLLIVFDRWFGTLAPPLPREALRYGLHDDGASAYDPIAIIARPWLRLAASIPRLVRRAGQR